MLPETKAQKNESSEEISFSTRPFSHSRRDEETCAVCGFRCPLDVTVTDTYTPASSGRVQYYVTMSKLAEESKLMKWEGEIRVQTDKYYRLDYSSDKFK